MSEKPVNLLLFIGFMAVTIAIAVVLALVCMIYKCCKHIWFPRTQNITQDVGSKYDESWRAPVFKIGSDDDDIHQYFSRNNLNILTSDWKESCLATKYHLGSKYDESWRAPVFKIGSDDDDIHQYFSRNNLNILTSDWKESCLATDKVVKVILCEMREHAEKRFQGLIIGKTLLKQGSSREGLKVCDPLEFDYILPFHIEGIKLVDENVFDSFGELVPGLIKRKVISDGTLQQWMQRYVVKDINGTYYLSSKNLQKLVFTSVLDQSLGNINKHLQTMTVGSSDSYQITQSEAPPSIKIKIKVQGKKGLKGFYSVIPQSATAFAQHESMDSPLSIEVDLVPGMLLSSENVPNLDVNNVQLKCERYAVMKWVKKKESRIDKDDRDILWRISTSGYEKHIFDVACRSESQLYVMTACRLLKGTLRKFKPDSENQLGSVLESYHLKNICLYCILFLTIPGQDKKLSGVREALGYFIKYIQLSLDAKFLPHFFHGNPYLTLMFPGSSFEKTERLNLFAFADDQTMEQARRSFPRFVEKLKGLEYYEDLELESHNVQRYEDMLMHDN